jgi:hypothetical protein
MYIIFLSIALLPLIHGLFTQKQPDYAMLTPIISISYGHKKTGPGGQPPLAKHVILRPRTARATFRPAFTNSKRRHMLLLGQYLQRTEELEKTRCSHMLKGTALTSSPYSCSMETTRKGSKSAQFKRNVQKHETLREKQASIPEDVAYFCT